MLKITKVQTALLEWLYCHSKGLALFPCHSKGQPPRELAHLESSKSLRSSP